MNDLLVAWQIWFSGGSLSDFILWGHKIFWWGRIGKIIQLVSALTIVIDLIGTSRLRKFGKSLHQTISLREIAVILKILAGRIPKGKEDPRLTNKAEYLNNEIGLVMMSLTIFVGGFILNSLVKPGGLLYSLVWIADWFNEHPIFFILLIPVFVMSGVIYLRFIGVLTLAVVVLIGTILDYVLIEPLAWILERKKLDTLIKIRQQEKGKSYMIFESLTEEQAKLLIKLIELQATGKYVAEFIAFVNYSGCKIRIRAKQQGEEDNVFSAHETDLLHLAENRYLTLIKTLDRRLENQPSRHTDLISDQANYKLSLTTKAYEHHKLLQQPASRTETPKSESRVTESSNNIYVDLNRIEELRSISNPKFDLTKLVKLCEELNECYRNSNYFAVAALTRSVLDHTPPVFGYRIFAEVANNYSEGTKSFKESMQHLEASSRKIADAHLHTQIRNKEVLPNRIQVNFSNDLDVLLSEIVRILR